MKATRVTPGCTMMATLLVLGCAGCRSPRSDVGQQGGFCEEWAALCPRDVEADFTLNDCKRRCERQGDMTAEPCVWAACSVETGFCDNDENDDTSIEACATAHGWLDGGASDFCADWATFCPGDVEADFTLEDCHQLCEVNGDMSAEPCAWSACSVETGFCDNEEYDDASIEACASDHGWL